MANDEEEMYSTLQGSSLLDTELTVCNICGETHHTENCRLISELKPVKDTPTISRARLTVPSGLKIETLADGSTSIIACAKFDQGTHFGPFQAPLTTDLHPGVQLLLKIFGKSGNDGYYLDTTDEETCNWMCLVPPASSASEQNLICYDMKQSVYFTAIKDILPGEKLKVWYALYYGLKMQALPLADESDSEEGFMDLPNNDPDFKLKTRTNVGQEISRELLESLAQHLPAHSLGVRNEKEKWRCRFCDKQECKVTLYAKHLMSHYRPKCDLCNRRFYSEEALLKHQKHRHDISESSASGTHQNNIGDTMDISEAAPLPQAPEAAGGEMTSTVMTEKWTENNENQITETNIQKNEESTKDPNVKIGLEDYDDTFCPLISVEKCDQEMMTINNLNTSEVVQTQLVIAEDGSIVYHVAHIPDGILATEIEKLGLLVVENESIPQINGAVDGSMWNAPTGVLKIKNNENGTQENNESVEHANTEIEPFCVKDSKEEIENCGSVALILLDSLGNENQQEQISVQKDKFSQQNTLNEQSESSSLVDMPSLMNDDPTKRPIQDTASREEGKDATGSFSCDICSKTFEKSAYLYRHLRKHTGEFTCVNCLAVFARKENLQSHPCTRPMVRYPCHICGKKFSAKKYLQRHIPLHTGQFTCEKCKRPFVSKLSLDGHRCRTDDPNSKESIKCSLCEQTFPDQRKLQSHLLHHSETNQDGNRAYLSSTQATRKHRRRKSSKAPLKKKLENVSIHLNSNGKSQEISIEPQTVLSLEEKESTEKDNGKGFICEICGSIFKSFSSMKTHRYLHGERRFECKICGKRFHRKDVLQEHITVHQSPQLPCSECGKKLKTKKSLEVHMMIHVGAKRFTCNDCGKEFYQKGNLIKHQRVHTPPADRVFPCQHCNKNFTSREYLSTHTLEHTQGKIFQCPHCSKSFVKKHLLEAHQQSTHSNKAFLCRYCNNLMRHRHSARRHLEQQHPEKQSEWSQPGFVDLMLAELPPDSLLLNNAAVLPGQQETRQEQLLSLRRQHFGNLMMTIAAEKEAISAHQTADEQTHLLSLSDSGTTTDPNQTKENGPENQDLTMEEIATLALQQQVELLADPLLGNADLQLDEINVIPIPFEENKQGNEILLEVVPQLQENLMINETGNGNLVPISGTEESLASKEDNAQVTIGGNTYILQDQVIFEDDAMASGDIFLYVLDSANQQ